MSLLFNEEDPCPALIDRLVSHLAESSAVLKSQQRHEADQTFHERKAVAYELLKTNPSEFLYRFGMYLKQEHLQYFYQFCGNPEIDHHLCETQKKLNKHTSSIMVKNRRFTALQRMKSDGSYFSECEMKTRDPLLYEQLIGDNLNDEEKLQSSKQQDSFIGLLFQNIDKQNEKAVKYEQERDEDDVREEFDSDDESEEDEKVAVTGKHKELLKNEFYSKGYSDFLTGKDKEFDYGKIDDSEEYDLLEIRERDEEEIYFDEDSSNEMDI